MSVVGASQLPIEVFGGLVTNIDPDSLPPGVSPDCADIAFEPGIPGTVKTRAGTSLVNQFGSSVKLNFLATFTDQQGNNRNLYFDTLERIWQEFPQNTFTQIGTTYQSQYVKSDTGFGREFMAFSDGKFGTDMPLQWDGTNLDRVSQDGPGLAPFVADGGAVVVAITRISQPAALNISIIIWDGNGFVSLYPAVTVPADIVQGVLGTVAGVTNPGYDAVGVTVQGVSSFAIVYTPMPAGPLPASSGGTFQSQLATVVTATPHGLSVGQQTTIAGSGIPAYDGVQTVFSVIDPNTFTFNAASAGNGPSAGATFTVTGSISAGIHQISVIFVTRSGYFTRPAPPASWTAAGGQTASVTNIPIGPSNVVARILIFTVSGGAQFFYSENGQKDIAGATTISAMRINDNTTTSATVDFSDLALSNSVSADDLFDLITLPEVAGFIQFGSRMLAWGARNIVPNTVNLSFDGGYNTTDTNLPLGWTANIGTSGTNYKLTTQTSPGASAVWGFGLGLLGHGGVAEPVALTIPVYQDFNKVPIISPNTSYSIHVRVQLDPVLTPTQGIVHVHLFSLSLGLNQGLDVTFGQLTTTFQEFSGLLTAGLPTVPSDLVLLVYINGTPTADKMFDLDAIQIFPTNEPNQSSVLYGSNVEFPEAFQGTTGFTNVNENDGNRLVALFIIRDRLYMTKSRAGLFATTEDASADFSDWTIDDISLRVGCESINGIGAHESETGEDWVFLFSRNGLYPFWSSEPMKCSQEIQPTWDQINWAYAHTAWCVTDVAKRIVLIGVPIGEATTPNKIFQMDYKMCGGTASEMAEAAPVLSTYTGQLKAHARSRKWSIWNLTMNSAGFIERNDGTAHLFLGNGAGTGELYDLLDENLFDVDGSINGYYITGAYPSDEQKEQVLQMKGNRVLLRYLTLFIQGIGKVQFTVYGPGFVNSSVVPIFGAPDLTLSSAAQQDMETMFNFAAERIFLKLQAVDDVSPWFSVQNMQLYVSQDPATPIRGFNQ